MRMMKNLFGIAAALIALTAVANAQTVVFNGIGSSALFLELGQAAGSSTSATLAGLGATCVWSNNSSVISATDPTTSQTESGNSWIAWTPVSAKLAPSSTNCAASSSTTIYAYLQTDSTVGDRCLFNACTIGATSSATSPTSLSTSGLIFGTSGEVALPTTVWTALSGSVVSVAGTDIRPEDAAFATLRATTGCNTAVDSSQYLGLGYTSGGTAIKSEYSSSSFHVTNFTLPTTSGSFAVTKVGAVPIVVFVNPGNTSGFGSTSFTNILHTDLAHFLDGTYGKTSDGSTGISGIYPTTVLIREPLSGTYNTMEYNVPNTTVLETSQDVGVNQIAAQKNCSGTAVLSNPLNIASNDDTSAYRNRVIGTGQMISTVLTLPAPLDTSTAQTTDTLGYAFWSTANFKNATSANAKYLEIDGVDPLVTSYSTTSGELPTSSNSLLTDVNFAHVIDGTYPIWSFLRLVNLGTASSAVTTAVADITSASQDFAALSSQPDFVPIASMSRIRSHFAPPSISFPVSSVPANGSGGSCSTTEAGGDVGGVILTVSADQTYCTANSTTDGQTGERN